MLLAALFDFNGTLIRSPDWMDLETRRLPEAALAELAARGVLPPPNAETLARAEAAFRSARQRASATNRETSHVDDLAAILETIGHAEDLTRQELEAVVAELHRRCLPSLELLPGAAEAVAEILRMGLRLAVISNAAYAPFLGWALDQFGLAEAFEQVVVSAAVGWRKPGTEIFTLTLARLGLPGEACAYIGDDYAKDVVAPKRAGLRAIWYNPLQTTPPDAAAEPEAVVGDLREIPGYLRRWRSV
jgi:putative hydrolase of the HAD superfamily